MTKKKEVVKKATKKVEKKEVKKVAKKEVQIVSKVESVLPLVKTIEGHDVLKTVLLDTGYVQVSSANGCTYILPLDEFKKLA